MVMTCALSGVIFDVDGVLVASPHEHAWRESLHELMVTSWAHFAPTTSYAPARFTSRLYQQLAAGKPRFSGALAALEYFDVPHATARAQEYADYKQRRLIELIAAGDFYEFPDAVCLALELKGRGLRLATASSSKNAGGLLQQTALTSYIDGDPRGWMSNFVRGGDSIDPRLTPRPPQSRGHL